MADIGELKRGESARVLGFSKTDKTYRKKLMAMGLLPGTEFMVVRVAPLGDPIEVKVRGFSLTLRKAEAQMLKIERIS